MDKIYLVDLLAVKNNLLPTKPVLSLEQVSRRWTTAFSPCFVMLPSEPHAQNPNHSLVKSSYDKTAASVTPFGDKDVSSILSKILSPEKIKFNQEILME